MGHMTYIYRSRIVGCTDATPLLPFSCICKDGRRGGQKDEIRRRSGQPGSGGVHPAGGEVRRLPRLPGQVRRGGVPRVVQAEGQVPLQGEPPAERERERKKENIRIY